MRQFVESYEACPIAIISRSVVRQAAVAGLANGNPAGAVVANVPVAVCIDEILRRAIVMTQRFSEFVPVARAICFEQSG